MKIQEVIQSSITHNMKAYIYKDLDTMAIKVNQYLFCVCVSLMYCLIDGYTQFNVQ